RHSRQAVRGRFYADAAVKLAAPAAYGGVSQKGTVPETREPLSRCRAFRRPIISASIRPYDPCIHSLSSSREGVAGRPGVQCPPALANPLTWRRSWPSV